MKKTAKKEVFLGIDLGTTTSQIAVVNSSGTVQVLPNMDGDLTTPSIVSVADKTPLVGKAAKQDLFLNPEKVAQQFKKDMATQTEGGNPVPFVTGADGTLFTAVTLSAEVLSYLKRSAEKLLGHPIEKAVVSVPAFFPRPARLATKQAGQIAELTDVHIIDEPTAAATYYGLTKGKDQIIAVFDFGGGTFDISLLDIKAGGDIEPIAVDGNAETGGANIDEAIFHQAMKFLEEKGQSLDAEADMAEYFEILESCKQAKELLAHKDTAIVPMRAGGKRFSMEVTYEQMKQWSAATIETLRNCCKRALEKAGSVKIDKVVLVGGSSRLRFVPEIVKDIFGQDPVCDTDPDLAVVRGNAILAAAHFSESDGELMIEGKRYLASSIRPGQIAGRALCVAAITKEETGDLREYNAPIIPSGAKLPYEAVECFAPFRSNLSCVHVKLIDGAPGELSANFTPLQDARVDIESTMDDKNEERIEFKISMDTEGLVDIKVRDKLLNKPVPIQFRFHTGLSENDIKQQRNELAIRHKG